MNADPEYHRKLERRDQWNIRWLWVRVFLTVLVIAASGYLLVNTHQIVNGHNADITQTKALVQRVIVLQKEHAAEIATIDADTPTITIAVGEVKSLATANHSSTIKVLGLICADLHIAGCPPGP